MFGCSDVYSVECDRANRRSAALKSACSDITRTARAASSASSSFVNTPPLLMKDLSLLEGVCFRVQSANGRADNMKYNKVLFFLSFNCCCIACFAIATSKNIVIKNHDKFLNSRLKKKPHDTRVMSLGQCEQFNVAAMLCGGKT